MVEPKRIVVVGGGITGLAAAHAAVARAREAGTAVAVKLLERGSRFGGNLVTDRVDGFILDAGPDSWVVSKPQAAALARELGLGGAFVGTQESARRYYIAWGNRLHPVPEGLVLGVPTRVAPLVFTRLFTWLGKLRMALEPFIPARRFEGDEDESIADFATRRLGREAAERLVAPLLGGISAGDASDLSVRAAFPQLVAMEREHGSLVRGMRAAQRTRKKARGSGKPGSAFVSFERGIATLPETLAARLGSDGVELRTGTAVTAVSRQDRRYVLSIEGGDPLAADAVLLAVPAHVASRQLAGLDAGVAEALGDVQYASTATVFLAYKTADLAAPLDGVGFVVPRALRRPILAATYVSSKWSGRAPDGFSLVRAFFGGASGEQVLAQPDDALTALARSELGALTGIGAEPVWSRVYRWNRVSAQMRVGHLGRMRALRERLATVAPGLFAAGGGYDGVGIPDCVRQGQEAGQALVDSVSRRG